MGIKITQRKLDAWKRSKKAGLDGIGFNDTWNLQKFGITKAEADLISRAMSHEYGLVTPTKPSLAKLNARLAVGL